MCNIFNRKRLIALMLTGHINVIGLIKLSRTYISTCGSYLFKLRFIIAYLESLIWVIRTAVIASITKVYLPLFGSGLFKSALFAPPNFF